ncbi:hypothetical protein BW41_02174 [Sphingomonas sp. RIT328]|nr:hypothetical protein BW41_02174 [Sphingomonas sp. RIT328]
MMVFLEVAIGATAVALLSIPVVIALVDRRKLTRPE